MNRTMSSADICTKCGASRSHHRPISRLSQQEVEGSWRPHSHRGSRPQFEPDRWIFSGHLETPPPVFHVKSDHRHLWQWRPKQVFKAEHWCFHSSDREVLVLHLNEEEALCCDKREKRKLSLNRRKVATERNRLNFSVVLQKHTWQTFILVICCFHYQHQRTSDTGSVGRRSFRRHL